MDKNNAIERLNEIKNYLENSSKFLSLSGWSGVWVGGCGIVAGIFAYLNINESHSASLFTEDIEDIKKFIFLALATLIIALSGAFYFTIKKLRKEGKSIVTSISKRIVSNFLIPMLAGGIISLILTSKNQFVLVAPLTLFTYGLSLLIVSRDLVKETKSLAILELILAIFSFYYLGNGLLFWSIGFGLLHIVYGVTIWIKYEQKGKSNGN